MYRLAVVYPLVDPHQPSEFEPSTTHAAAAHFQDRIAANNAPSRLQ
jgi:hypothetical protein